MLPLISDDGLAVADNLSLLRIGDCEEILLKISFYSFVSSEQPINNPAHKFTSFSMGNSCGFVLFSWTTSPLTKILILHGGSETC